MGSVKDSSRTVPRVALGVGIYSFPIIPVPCGVKFPLMKRILSAFTLLLLGACQLQAQTHRTYLVKYTRQINADSLNAVYRQNRTPAHERARTTLNLLRQISASSGKALETHLDQLAAQKDAQTVQYQKHWLVNALMVEAPVSVGATLSGFPEVDYVEDISDLRFVLIEPTHMEDDVPNRAVGEPEPGLLAVGARTLWDMGYTGRGLKLLSFDTGIWPNHPALGGRFYGDYMPLSLAWQQVFSPVPADKSSSHGTHTVGTMAGLDTATHDTIGLAFKAYFMATDPIVSNLADTIGTINIMHKYEWALDPDNNPNTTDDMPAVICNSWGVNHQPGFCGSFVSDMLVNIDLTGIANEYSAGNEGPGTTTVGVPAMINPGLLNSFAVGAINGNVASYPIASFSSRGPTSCPSTGSQQIKPEVVAPGVSVRSCVKNMQYAFYDGTSMAGPHVAGVMMLLKEAFPTVAGETLKEALYYSAIDLGDPGEDNTYGMGMINAGAAFDWLVNEGYVPVSPVSNGPELALEKGPVPMLDFACGEAMTQTVYLYNEGTVAINDTVFFKAHFNGDSLIQWKTFVSLAPQQRSTLAMPVTYTPVQGTNELWIKAWQKNTPVEKDLINNNRTYRHTLLPEYPVSYLQRFEVDSFEFEHWTVINRESDRTFELLPCGGQDVGDTSVGMRFYMYNTPTGQVDWLISPPITMAQEGNHFVAFDVAYHYKNATQKDTISLLASLDCGQTFTETIFTGAAADLATYTGATPNNFKPTLPEHWKRLTFPLPNTWNGNKVLFAFRSVNHKGGNAYLDDFAVYSDIFAGIPEPDALGVSVYPNPFREGVTLSFAQSGETVTLGLFDLSGRQVESLSRKGTDSFTFTPRADLPAGVYFLRVNVDSKQSVHKLVKQ